MERSPCRLRRAPASPIAGTPLGVSFIDVATQSGLNAKTIYGGEGHNEYLLETTGCGVAFYDYDQDGWLDLFLVNGWRLEGFASGHEHYAAIYSKEQPRRYIYRWSPPSPDWREAGGDGGCCVGVDAWR